MQLLTIVWLPIRFILCCIISPIVTLGYFILVVCVGLPSHIFRKFVSFVGHRLDNDLENLVTAIGSITARDYEDWCSHPSQSIVVIIKLKGEVTPLQIQQHVLREIVHKWNADKENLENPELQQYCTKRLGYLFFKWDRKFDISNHVKLYKSRDIIKNNIVNDEKLMEIWERVGRRPYAPKRSPWEILIVPNYHTGKITEVEDLNQIPTEQRQSVLILRIHHSLTDGFSVYRLLLSLTDEGLAMWEKETGSNKTSKCFYFLLYLKALILGPMGITWAALEGFDVSNPLHFQQKYLTGKYHIVKSTLNLDLIKNIKTLHNVTFHTIIIAGIAGGFRNYLIKNEFKLPLRPIKLGIPIPKPSHSTKLRNEYFSSIINLPVVTKSAKHRLILCERRLQDIGNGALLPFLTLAMQMIGGFPLQCIRYLTRLSGFTVLLSEMKGPDKAVAAFGGKVILEDLMYSFGLGTDDLGIGFSAMSYNGKFHIILTLDRGIFNTKEKANQLIELITKEIEGFQFGDSTNL